MVKGSKHSKEAKDKISKANKGHQSLVGNIHALGYTHTKEAIKKIGRASRKPIKFIKDSSGCYLCTSHHNNTKKGYPTTLVAGKHIRISRYLYTLKYGSIPDGMLVCHTCDNPLCINLKHFFLGTAKDNAQDMVQKGRSLFGERHKRVKLTEAQIKEIISHPTYKGANAFLSRQYCVSDAHISRIRLGQSWKHLL